MHYLDKLVKETMIEMVNSVDTIGDVPALLQKVSTVAQIVNPGKASRIFTKGINRVYQCYLSGKLAEPDFEKFVEALTKTDTSVAVPTLHYLEALRTVEIALEHKVNSLTSPHLKLLFVMWAVAIAGWMDPLRKEDASKIQEVACKLRTVGSMLTPLKLKEVSRINVYLTSDGKAPFYAANLYLNVMHGNEEGIKAVENFVGRTHHAHITAVVVTYLKFEVMNCLAGGHPHTLPNIVEEYYEDIKRYNEYVSILLLYEIIVRGNPFDFYCSENKGLLSTFSPGFLKILQDKAKILPENVASSF